MATLPLPLRLCGRVGHQPLCWGVSWTTLPGVANDQSTLINNGRLSPFGGTNRTAMASWHRRGARR
ncbi:hypothetical protein E2C01_063799 [Portunus trituberculatus]|uniref:Uncharacterized protein n=1 Tax=Portunus trituberculatus TaxID=210409 RepID=A0A5B7HBG2_PORTR|nr:hypothetical protein [Portunus trituberculatus]